jgi:alpha-beta hydrolase superfamily lysophospholipase
MNPRPIVLVHGAWHGPWCWDEVADGLRAAGHAVDAVELPGHGTPGEFARTWKRIGAYVAEVDRTVELVTAANGAEPVLVGHSMGGYVVQRYLERHAVHLGVLVASAPRLGALGANIRLLRRHPLLFLKCVGLLDYSHAVRTDELVRELLFQPDTPAEIVADTRARLQNESAVALATMTVRWPRPHRVTTPMRVIAAEHDAIFTVDEQHLLAAAYGVEMDVVAGSGHDVMLDTQRATFLELLVDIVSEAG